MADKNALIDDNGERSLLAENPSNERRRVQVDTFDRLVVSDEGNNKTAFDELSVAEPSPVVQVQFPYNINTDIWEVRDNNGTASIANNLANLSTGARATASSTILSRTPVKYNPGQGGLCRFTAVYSTAVANSTQYVGIGNSTDGYFIGYEGTTFGILRRQGGKPETRRLAITTASSTAEAITITLNGVAESGISVTNAGVDSQSTRTITANDIVAHDWSNVGEGWEVHNMGANVFFTSFSTGAKLGTYEITTATNAAGTFFQSLLGVSETNNIIAQTDWNIDTLDGSGGANNPSSINLDTSKGNVYQIRYQWLGFGTVEFYVEHSEEGDLHLIHIIEYANANTVPSVDNPTLPLFAQAKNTSNTSDVVLRIGSMAGFVEGRDTLKGLPKSFNIEAESIGTTETPIMTVHSHDIYQSTLNRVKTKFTLASVSVEGTKPATIRLRKNAILIGSDFRALDSNTSIMHVDGSATVVTGGTIIYAQSIEKIGHSNIDLEKIGVELVAPDFLTLSIEASAGTLDTVSTLNWQELF